MNLRKRLGLPDREKSGDMPKINMSDVQIPIDLLLEIIIRQQNQIFQENSNLNGRIAASEIISAGVLEQMEHLHNDVVELQQHLQSAGQHPVERVDEESEREQAQEKAQEKKKLIH